ncbi:hypothetical protein AB0I28_32510 [Phytomonospora sp. NPDC050363]|uniref:hypothetical protein n=1 Tax=Phytomonospora sp. NPDC050363 TaxID=3155642 RepID=UPI0033E28C2B
MDEPAAKDAAPTVLWDVDGVLNAAGAAHTAHVYDGPGPTGALVTGTVYLNPVHGEWMAELTTAGARHAWATSWGHLARSWIAPRLHPPAADWPVIDVGIHGGVRFGHSYKFSSVTAFLGRGRPVFWVDDVVGGKDRVWAEERTARGVPTVVCEVTSPAGLARVDVDAALAWLAAVRGLRA